MQWMFGTWVLTAKCIVEINLQSYFGIIAILSGLWVIWSTLSNLVPILLSLKCILCRALPDITVRSGSPANFQSPDSPKTGRSPSRTPDFYHLKKWGKKIKKKISKKKFQKKFSKFFSRFFFCLFNWSGNFRHQIFVQVPYLMKSNNLLLVGETFKNISPDSVRSGRTCPANLGVRSCPVRKLICPVRSSPTQ